MWPPDMSLVSEARDPDTTPYTDRDAPHKGAPFLRVRMTLGRSGYVVGLIRAERRGDREHFASLVKCIIADARSKSHHRLADAYEHASTAGASHSASYVEQLGGTLMELVPKRRLSDLMLEVDVRSEIKELITEHQQAEQLEAAGLTPRNRVLLTGPPGNGKTSLAEVIATETDRPLFVVSDQVVSPLLGETSAKLNKVFRFIAGRPCVFFLDEFDAISAQRSYEVSAAKEMSRIVTSVLLWLERVPAQTIVVAATNVTEAVDFAMWRRMQLVLRLCPPTPGSAKRFIKCPLRQHGASDVPPEFIIKSLPDASYAELEQIALDIGRLSAIEGAAPEGAAERVLSRWQRRTAVIRESRVPITHG